MSLALAAVVISPVHLLRDRSISATFATQARQQRLIESYSKLPLSFELNQGQTDRRVRFLSRGSGYGLFLTANEAVLTLQQGRRPSKPGAAGDSRRLALVNHQLQPAVFKPAGGGQHSSQSTAVAVVRMRLVGANPQARISGLDGLPGKSNYFIGNDPRHWRSNVPNYARVKYANVYPGVDLVYYGNQRQLEYDFVVQPGADPHQIELNFDGAKHLRLDEAGNLIISMVDGEIIEHKPLIYHNIKSRRRPIAGVYELRRGGRVGFKIGTYDHQRSLTLDPTLVYSTYLGGSSFESGFGIALDSAGNAYITGDTSSTDFPTTPGAFQTTLHGLGDAFISKLNSHGSALIYSTYLGGGFGDGGLGIALDSAGNAYITGMTQSSDFPTTAGAFQTTLHGSVVNAFISKLNRSGSALVYSTYLGGNGNGNVVTYGNGIAVDSVGNAYITGTTASSDFPTTPGAFQTTLRGRDGDAFVSKLDRRGSALVYSTYLGGSFGDVGYGIALDAAGNAYVTGTTESSDFPTTAGAFQTSFSGEDAFVSKLNSSGSALVYSTYLGGGNGYGIALDSAGNAYITGDTASSDFPTTPGAFQTTYGGGYYNAFISKLNRSGSALVYSTYLGGSGSDEGFGDRGFGIAVDSAGNAYVIGATESSDFPTTARAFRITYGGGVDAFVSKFSFGIPFAQFGGHLRIDPDTGIFFLNGDFTLGPGGSINPLTQQVTFKVGNYSVTLPAGSFAGYKSGYVYQKTVNNIFLCIYIKSTSTPGKYSLLANSGRDALTGTTTSPVPVTLTIGDNSGSTQMKTRFD